MSEADGAPELDVWGVQAEALRLLGRHFVSFQVVYWAVFGPYLVAYSQGLFKPLGTFAPEAILVLLMPLADAALILLLLDPEEPSAWRALGGALRRYWRVLWVALLVKLAVVAGLLCAVLPGAFLWTRYSLALVVAVREEETAPFRALFRSSDLVYGQTLRVAGALALLVLVSLACRLAVVLWGGVQSGEPADWTQPVNVVIDQLQLAFTVLAVVLYRRLAPAVPAEPSPPAEPAPEAEAQ